MRIYGELEFFFAMLKILYDAYLHPYITDADSSRLVVGLNILSLILVSGGGANHHEYGFQY